MADRVPPAHRPVERSGTPHPSGTSSQPLARVRGAQRFQLRRRARDPLFWELRLESPDGAATWGLPHGVPWEPDAKREALALPEADASDAPAWDRGPASVVENAHDEVVIELKGRRIRGQYALRPHLEDHRAWTIERLDPANPAPMPDPVAPMLATTGAYPDDPESWAFEMKWDGIRALARLHDGGVTVRSRNLADITAQYPELQELATLLPGRDALLDGEIVAPVPGKQPSFQRLQARFGVTGKAAVRQKMEDVPIVYVVFDVLHLDGHDLTLLPYEERRAVLESLRIRGARCQTPPVVIGDGRGLLAIPGGEGVVAKRLGSAYERGARSAAWRKIKRQRRQELVVGGYTHGKGARRGAIGSLMMGHYDDEGRLHYAGNVGTGFTEKMLEEIERRLKPHVRDASPFAGPVDKPGVFVEPLLVAEVEFTEWTRDGHLRHPSFKGFRFDKDPRDVRREEM